MSRDTSLDDIINEMLTAAEDERAAQEASPRTVIKRNPWIYQGFKLITSKIYCTQCQQTHTISHGLVKHYIHKDDPNKVWSTQMERTSLNLPLDEYLGEEALQSAEVFGCQQCHDLATIQQQQQEQRRA